MERKIISKDDFKALVGSLIAGQDEVVGVVAKGKNFAFDALDTADELCMDYDMTILPPKKYFLPVKGALLNFKVKDAGSYEALKDCSKRIILGVHPEDLAAIALLDKAHTEGESDDYYLNRRDNSVIVGLNPTVPNEYRFTNSMVTDEADNVADVMLTDLGDGTYAAEINSDKGATLLKDAAAAGDDVVAKIDAAKAKIADSQAMPMDKGTLAAFLDGKEKNAVFGDLADKCFSCGSCVLVCPTCYCFDVTDELELDLQSGTRVRKWDGCTITNFATVAGDHNFRDKAADRLRHRIFRKGKYMYERFGMAGCVGCGRCAKACTADIANPVTIINDIKAKEA